jgi:OPA family glycerol-3-phosphate transporter-like MFS transporter 3
MLLKKIFSKLKGLFVSGILGDRFNLRYVLALGMTLTSISIFLFGVLSEWMKIYNKFYYITFWIINGLVQSTGNILILLTGH